MKAPSVDYAAVAPMLIVFVAALLAVLVEAFAPRAKRFVSQVVLAALYILLTYQRMFTGPVKEYAAGWKDASPREVLVIAPLVVVILFLGVYPKPVLDVINPAIATTLQQVGETDPTPTVAVEGGENK